MAPKITQCKSCGADIMFVENPCTGSRVPIDAKPVPMFGVPYYQDGAWYSSPTDKLHINHFITCPSRDQHRKGPPPKTDEEARNEANTMAEANGDPSLADLLEETMPDPQPEPEPTPRRRRRRRPV